MLRSLKTEANFIKHTSTSHIVKRPSKYKRKYGQKERHRRTGNKHSYICTALLLNICFLFKTKSPEEKSG